MPCTRILVAASFGALALAFAVPVLGQRDEGGIAAIGNAITYQGVLKQGGSPLNGTCDVQMSLWNALTAGTQIGTTQTFLAQSVSGGLITISPDFGSGAFDGNDRWIEIAVRAPAGGGSYVPLTPRQKLSAVPYALFSVGGNTGFTLPYAASASSAVTDLFSITNTAGGGLWGRLGGVDAGAVGKHNATGNIGFVGHAGYGVFASAAGATSIGVRGIHVPTGHDGELGDPIAGVLGQHLPTGNLGRLGTADYGIFGQVQATTSFAVYGENLSTGTNGRLGDGVAGVDGLATINNGRPGVRGYHLPSNNYGVLGTTLEGAFGLHSATGNTGHLGTDVSGVRGVGVNGAGVRGFHLSSGSYGELGGFPNQIGAGVYGNEGGGGWAGLFDGRVEVNGTLIANLVWADANFLAAAIFNRLGDDGVVVDIRQAGITEGTISVSGMTVSYNAFTGSHYGWTPPGQTIERGTLVCLTGVNRHSHDDTDAEVIYGIAPSTIANNPKCMGAYLCLQEPNKPQSNENPHLIMAVGNGDMWVAESGIGNIQPGDYLISSDVPGCAMKDDPQRFPIGYIVARAGEAVDWSTIDSPTDGSAKRKKISVFFENFVRDSRGAELATIVQQQNQRIESLEAQVRSLQSIAERLAALERSQPGRAPVATVSKSPSVAGGGR